MGWFKGKPKGHLCHSEGSPRFRCERIQPPISFQYVLSTSRKINSTIEEQKLCTSGFAGSHGKACDVWLRFPDFPLKRGFDNHTFGQKASFNFSQGELLDTGQFRTLPKKTQKGMSCVLFENQPTRGWDSRSYGFLFSFLTCLQGGSVCGKWMFILVKAKLRSRQGPKT